MSLTDPMKIAEWLINRAGTTAGAEAYKKTIIAAKGMLLTPSATGPKAVELASDMATHGAAVRKAESTGTAVVPAAAAAAAPAPAAADAANAAAAAPAPEANAAPAAAAAAPGGGRTRKARHQTPKRKRLSRKKSIKHK
jgi:hypothetical protein